MAKKTLPWLKEAAKGYEAQNIDQESYDKSTQQEKEPYIGIGADYPNKKVSEYEDFLEYLPEKTVKSGDFQLDQLVKMRAEQQGVWEELGNKSLQFGRNIVPQVISGFASMVDIPGYFDAEHAASNSIVNWAADWKKESSEMFPVYRENPNKSLDLGDSAWWIDSGGDIFESVISFLAQGAGVGKVASLGAKAIARSLQAKKLVDITGMGAETAKMIGQGASALGSAVALNHSEAVIEATMVYNETIQHWLEKGYSYEDANKQAAIAASTTINLNRANILLNLTSASAFLQPMKLTRQLITAPTIGRTLGKIAGEGVQEAGEELINHVAGQAGRAYGKGEEYDFDNAMKDMTSAQGIEAAILGAFGGIAQTGGTSALQMSKYGPGSTRDESGNRVSAYSQNMSRYQQQQEIIEKMKASGVKTSDVFMNLKNVVDLHNQLDQAAEQGNQTKYEELQSKLFENQALQAFQTGTTEVLENLIKSVNQEEGADQLGITKDKVNEVLDNLKQLEKVYNNFEEYTNVDDIFFNRANKIRSERVLDHLTNEQMGSKMDLTKTIDRIAKKYQFTKDQEVVIKKDGKVVDTETRTSKIPLSYSFSDLENNSGDSKENQEVYDQFLNEVKQTPSYKTYNEYQEQIDKGEAFALSLDAQFNDLTSPKAQEEALLKKQQQQIDNEHLKIINDSTQNDISILNKIAEETKNQNIKQKANDKIAKIKADQSIADQKKKDDVIFKKHAFDIASAKTIEDLTKIQTQLDSADISSDLRNSLNSEIENRKYEIENGLASTIVDEVTTDEKEDVELKDSNLDSGLPSDFQDAESNKDVDTQVEELAKQLAKEEAAKIIDEKGDVIYSYDKTDQGHDKAAYLSREYAQLEEGGIVTREEIDNSLRNINPDLLDPNKLTEGTPIKIRVKTEFKGDVYSSSSVTKEKKTWLEREQELQNELGPNYKTSQRYKDEVPLVAEDELGNELFYIHDVNWITPENVEGSDIDLHYDREALRKIRQQVIDSPNGVTTKINSKSPGVLFKTANGEKISVSEAMPDNKLSITIGKDGVYTGINLNNKSIVNKENPKDGRVYAVIPYGKDNNIAIQLERDKLSDQISDTIVKAVGLYLSQDENNPIVQEIAKAENGGFDLTSISGLRNYVSQFTYLFPTEGKEGLNSVLYRSTDKLNSENRLLAVTGNSIEFGRPTIGNGAKSISLNSPKNKIPDLLHALKTHLSEAYVSANKEPLLKDSNIAIISFDDTISTIKYTQFIKDNFKTNVLSANIGTEEKPNYIYTIQPTITFDTTFANIEPIQKETKTFEDEIEADVSDQILEQQAQEKAKELVEYPTERLQSQLSNLQAGIYDDFKYGLNQLPTHAELAHIEKVIIRTLEIRSQDQKPKTYTDSDGNVWEIPLSDDIDEGEDDYLPSISNETEDVIRKEVDRLLITGLTSSQQDSLINYIASSIVKKGIEQKEQTGKAKFDPSEVFEIKKKDIESIRDLYQQNGIELKAEKLDIILKEYDKVKRLVNEYLSLLSTGRISDSEIDSGEEATGGLENTLHSDDWTLTLDSKSTASAELKKFFSFIEDKENGLTKKNSLGFPEVIPFDTVYNTLHEILQGLPADYKMIEQKLELYTQYVPWLQSVIEKLDDAPESIKNEFVSDMTKHAIKMRFVMWTKNKNGSFSMIDQDANSSSIQKRLITIWGSNIKSLNNINPIITINEDSIYIFNEEISQKVINQAKEWEKNIKNEVPDTLQLKNWLSNFGITLSDRTLDDLRNGKFKNGKFLSYSELFTNSKGLVKVLSKQLEKSVVAGLTYEESKLLNDTVVKSLAMMESLRNVSVFSNSFNAGGKTIYSFTNNKFVVNRMRDLTATDQDDELLNKDLIEGLKTISFTQDSLWLEDLTAEGELGNITKEVLGVDYLSLEALKKQYTSSVDDRKLNKLNIDEHEAIKLALFFNNSGGILDGQKRRKVSFFYPTMSDKSSMMIINALSREVQLTDNNELTKDSLDLLYKAIVLPEIKRITSNKKAKTLKGYEPDYFYFVPELNTKEIVINDVNRTIKDHILANEEITGELKEAIKNEVSVMYSKLLDEKLTDWDNLGIGKSNKSANTKFAFLDDAYMSSSNVPGVGNQKVKYAAADFIFNSLIANVEAFKLIVGDPAQYAKFKKGKDVKENLEETFINIGKRLAADIAPGIELADSVNNQYYQVFLNDKKLKSKNMDNSVQREYLKKILNKTDFDKYNKIEGSDAQEYTTWKEHLYVMKQLGRLSESQYSTIYSKLSKEQRLTYSELQTVLQPMKPVYVGNKLELDQNIDRRIYIKSSSFPLLPQLTKGLEIDKIRKALETFEKSKIDEKASDGSQITIRASFNTANKVGGIKNSIDVFDDNGNVLDNINIKDSNTLLLSRKDFRIQQDVPYNYEKEAINIGTQERKLLFNNILDIGGFEYNGEKLNGSDLKKIYDETYHELFKYKQQKLKEELGIVTTVKAKKQEFTTGKLSKLAKGEETVDDFKIDTSEIEEQIELSSIPVVKLKEILIKEIKGRQGYPLNIIASLELNSEGTDFKIPLWSSPYADKFESLLTSIVNNGVIKQKFNGHSYVLGSEEGFKVKEGNEANEDLKQSGIVFSPEFDPIKGLQPMRFEDGKLLPAQIMIPFNFKDKSGSKLSLIDFVKIEDGKKMIDFDKIPKKILNLFGFRIPTQGHNSMSSVEIVGFLPEESGDLLLAPRDFTVQMGSDFDVDKLYTYMYNVRLQDGKLTTEFDDETGFVENQQNKILDIHHSVMSNSELAAAILAPDSFGDFENLAKEVYDLRKQSGEVPEIISILSDVYQRTKYINATAGKDGVANFSIDSTFNALIQDKDLVYDPIDPFRVTFGKNTSTGELSNKYTLRSQRLLKKGNFTEDEKKSLKLKSSVIQGLQSSAVDNEKAQILDKLNINSDTFDAIRAMSLLGFEENEITGLLTQDIIWKFINTVKAANSSLTDFTPNLVENFKTSIKENYDPNDRLSEMENDEIERFKSLSGKELLNNLKSKQLIEVSEDQFTPDSNIIQILLLDKFLELSEVGKSIKVVQSSINTESSGLPKNLLETESKVQQINRLASSNIKNAEKLLGEYIDGRLSNPTTINGDAAYYGALFANNIYAKYFPYNSGGLNIQVNELLEHTNNENASASKKLKMKGEMFKEVKSYLFTDKALGLYEGPLEENQRRLFIDSDTNKSLATIISTLSVKKWFKGNNFLNKLTTDLNFNGIASRVNFEASTGENYDERSIYLGFLDLIDKNISIGQFNGIEYTTRTLAQDLIAYSFLEGGTQGSKQFLKYIPIEYIKGAGFGKALSDTEFSYLGTFGGQFLTESNDTIYTLPSRFIRQYFQNNPDKVRKIDLDQIDKAPTSIKDITEFKIEKFSIGSFIKEYIDDKGIERSTSTQFLAVYDSTLPSKHALFQFDNTTRTYKRIPVLSGKYGFKQYNSQSDINTSIQQFDDPVTLPVIDISTTSEMLDMTAENPVVPTYEYNPDIAANPHPIEKLGTLELNTKLKGEEALKDLMKKLSLSESLNPYYQELIKEYSKLELPKGLEFKITKEGATGSFSVKKNTLKLNTVEMKDYNINQVSAVVLHELTHVFTSDLIKKSTTEQGQKSLTSFQKASIARLKGLQLKYVKHLIKTGKSEELYSFRNAYAKFLLDEGRITEDKFNIVVNSPIEGSDSALPNLQGEITDETLSEFYGALKLEEFVAMAQTDIEFQKILNNVIDSDGKSFLAKLLDQIVELMKAIGIDIKSGSLLEQSLIEINNLLESQIEKPVVKTNPFVFTEPIDFGDEPIKLDKNNINFEDFLPSPKELEEFKRICK